MFMVGSYEQVDQAFNPRAAVLFGNGVDIMALQHVICVE